MRKYVVLCLLLASLCWPLASQSSSIADGSLNGLPDFDNSFVYQVPGQLLNEWKTEYESQQSALMKADARLANAETSFAEASKAASASLTLFVEYRRSIQAELWLTRAAFVAAVVVLSIRSFQ